MVGLIINFRALFLNPSVEYGQRFQGHERAETITCGCRKLNLFLLQLLVLTFAYVLGAYFYKSIILTTPVDWLSLARRSIEASCDNLHFPTFLVAVWLIPISQTHVDNHLAVLMDMLLVIKMNQFVMMRYAEFYPRACANSIRVGFFNFLCPRLDSYPMERLFAVCVFPTGLLPYSFTRTDSSLSIWLFDHFIDEEFSVEINKCVLLNPRPTKMGDISVCIRWMLRWYRTTKNDEGK